jgi:hypothetical protein
MYLGLPHQVPYLAVAVDGHAVTNLNCESKDKGGHLVQPTELARDECYAVALDLLLHGRVAFLFVDGSRGRAALIVYIIEHGGHASPLSQDALRRLGLSLCLMTGLSATNGGSIFLLYIHGYMTIVFLRPSVGSYAFNEFRRNGPQGMVSAPLPSNRERAPQTHPPHPLSPSTFAILTPCGVPPRRCR